MENILEHDYQKKEYKRLVKVLQKEISEVLQINDELPESEVRNIALQFGNYKKSIDNDKLNSGGERMRKYPCCMCPAQQYDFQKDLCNGETSFLGKLTGKCDFVNTFIDEREWVFFVRAGLGESNYKTFYKKPEQNTMGHAYKSLPWRKTFQEAQQDLNELALKKGWKEV